MVAIPRDAAILKLAAGETVQIRCHGNSMVPRIHSGDLITLRPPGEVFEIGDAVLCKVRGNVYVHLIKALKPDQALIGNNHGGTNGWTNFKNIYGVVIGVEK